MTFKIENLSVLWLKWTQAMEIKQNQTIFHGTYSNLTLYLPLSKSSKIFQWLSSKVNKITRDMCKSDSIFVIYKIVHYLNDFWNLFLDKVYH